MSEADHRSELNWITTGIEYVAGLGSVDWEAFTRYASEAKRRRDGDNLRTPCRLSPEYNMGGLNLVRRMDFQDGTRWVARIRMDDPAHSADRLASEVHAMALVRERSGIPVPEVYAFEAGSDNPVRAPFILMEFVPGNTVVDTVGSDTAARGTVPFRCKAKFYASLADIQARMSAIRFANIGRITKRADGSYDIGPLPRLGGPFSTSDEFFKAWAREAAFPRPERFIRQRISAHHAEEVLESIESFPSSLSDLAKSAAFRDGPFPLCHTDLGSSNIIVDSQFNILSVIDWEGAFAAPWEAVAFAKDLSIIPPSMEVPPRTEGDVDGERSLDRRNYIDATKKAEESRELDNCLSSTLEDPVAQHLASAIFLYEEGKIGLYGAVLDAIRNRSVL